MSRLLCDTTVIPRTLGRGDDLIVMPRKEYERLRSYEMDNDAPVVLTQVPLSSLTKEQLRAYREVKRTPLSKMLNI